MVAMLKEYFIMDKKIDDKLLYTTLAINNKIIGHC